MGQANLAAEQEIYAAFGRGDLPAILDRLAEDIDWREVGRPGDYPPFGPRRGKAEVAAFFGQVAETAEFSDFAVDEIDACGDKVFVLGRNTRAMKRSGRTVESAWIQVFTFEDGKVTRFIEFIDTAAVAEAYRG